MKHIDETTLQELREKLEAEKKQLEESLATSGEVIDGEGDWAATPPEADDSEQDPTVQADRFEDFYNRGGAVAELEARLEEVKTALTKMDEGTYGLSKMSGAEISVERLKANPAASTTVDDMGGDTSDDHTEPLIEN